jgi:NDP-sugar pyrophosphorylase family protein
VPRIIRKAVLLAAGRGTRLGVLTANTPKPLIEVAGDPLIGHIVGGLADAGIAEVAIVIGYLGEQIEQWCEGARRAHPQIRLHTIRQAELNGTAGAMLAAKKFIAAESGFIFGWGDILMDRANYPRFAAAARDSDCDLMVAVNRMRDPWRGSAVYVDAAMRVERIIEKPPRGTSTTNWNSAGLFATTQLLFDYIARLAPSERGELELPQAIAAMIEDGCDVRALDVRGFWRDVGTAEDLEEARQRFRPGGGDG